MKSYRYLLLRHKLLLAALFTLILSQSTYLRVLLRSILEGPVFQWGYYVGVSPSGKAVMARGHGLEGHTDHLLVHGLVLAWLVWAGCRRADAAFRLALFGWTSIAVGMELWFAFTFGAELTVSKETIGLINVPAVYITLPPVALAWLMALGLMIQNRADDTLPIAPWTPMNTGLVALGGLGMAAAAVALNTGPQHGGGDLAGVILIHTALTVLFVGVSPWARRSAPST